MAIFKRCRRRRATIAHAPTFKIRSALLCITAGETARDAPGVNHVVRLRQSTWRNDSPSEGVFSCSLRTIDVASAYVVVCGIGFMLPHYSVCGHGSAGSPSEATRYAAVSWRRLREHGPDGYSRRVFGPANFWLFVIFFDTRDSHADLGSMMVRYSARNSMKAASSIVRARPPERGIISRREDACSRAAAYYHLGLWGRGLILSVSVYCFSVSS